MTEREINHEALFALENQNWPKAQQLFFKNAKIHPSHNTYNNLGFYLITEGIICKDGKFRNAHKLGMKYLLRAAEKEYKQLNLCAIAKAYDLELMTSKENKKEEIYAQEYEFLSKALNISYKDEIQYNVLRILYNCGKVDKDVLNKSMELVNRFKNKESICLYFEILKSNSMIDEALQCIKDYKEYLELDDILLFYTKFGLYEEGYSLCEDVINQYEISESIASAIIESCIKCEKDEDVKIYIHNIENMFNEMNIKRKSYSKILNSLDNTSDIRKKYIDEYQVKLPFLDMCCYYGCSIHGTDF